MANRPLIRTKTNNNCSVTESDSVGPSGIGPLGLKIGNKMSTDAGSIGGWGGDEAPISLSSPVQRDAPAASLPVIRGHKRTPSGGSIGKSKNRRGSSKAYASLNSRPPTPDDDGEGEGDVDSAISAIAEATIPSTPAAASAPSVSTPWATNRAQVRYKKERPAREEKKMFER